jgi:hypothetical protein
MTGPWSLVLGSGSVLGPSSVRSPESLVPSDDGPWTKDGPKDQGRTKNEEPSTKDHSDSSVAANANGVHHFV